MKVTRRRLLQTSKVGKKNVTIFRATGSRLSAGVGPSAGDQEYPPALHSCGGRCSWLHSCITIHHCSTGSTLVRLCSTKIPLDVSATTAGLAGVGFVNNSNLASKLTTFESQTLAEPIMRPCCHLTSCL